MSKTPLIVTIDAEGDDLWARPREVTTQNAAYLPRCQALCERLELLFTNLRAWCRGTTLQEFHAAAGA